MTLKYLPFIEAREYVRNQNLKNAKEWKEWSKGTLKGKGKRPKFIPSSPDIVYKYQGWVNWDDWIKKTVEFLPFQQAREYVRKLGLKNQFEWQKYYQGKLEGKKKPENIPWNPEKIYADKWQGIKDWLGTEWQDFQEAREFVRSLGLNGQAEWRLYYKNELDGYDPKPGDIPTDPKRVYKNKGWIDMSDWLGTERKRRSKNSEIGSTWLPYEDAKRFVHSLKLSSYDEWKLYIGGNIDTLPSKPTNIPKSPQFVYKDNGWKGWSDWLGNTVNGNPDEKNIISKKKEFLHSNIQKHEIVNSFSLQELLKEYENNSTIFNLLSFFHKSTSVKSIIELDLTKDDVDEVEKNLLNFRGNAKQFTPEKKAFIGLVFLTYVTYRIEPKLSYSTMWKVIVNDLEQYSKITRYFLDSYFTTQSYPNIFLKESIEYACNLFHLRNNFDAKDEQQYLRNTILLQIGLLNNSFDNLKLWLSNYSTPVTISELLDSDSENYSKEFHDGWRVLRRFRDNILSNEQAKNLLHQNIWFKYLNLDELLKVAKQKYKKSLMATQDEDLPVFYLEKITYSDTGLSFTINAQDIYSLNLNGFRYEIYVDGEYKGVLIANSSKELILESPITILNPEVNQIVLEVKNEDNDVVYATEIILFDFSEQIILFDEDGNIYQNIFKKLNSHKKYHILMDSDLDSGFNYEMQREYFEGYATLVPFIGHKDNCKIKYNDEVLFELNFTEYIEKPEFIDHLVMYSATNSSFVIDSKYRFELKIMQIDLKTEEVSLLELPQEAKILKWSYFGGYVDSEEIENNSMTATLYPEMIVFPKHTLFIKYKKRVFKRVVYCNFFEEQNHYRLFQIDKHRGCSLINSGSYLTKKELKENSYYMSDFDGFNKIEKFYLKNKVTFYQILKPNKKIRFTAFNGFGETIFISEHLFHAKLIKIFNYKNSDEFVSINQNKTSKLHIHRELPQQCKIILLDKTLQIHQLPCQDVQNYLSNNIIIFDFELVSVLVVQGNSIIDSSYDESFLGNFSDNTNSQIMNFLLLSNYSFLSRESYTNYLKRYIKQNIKSFFSTFYSDRITIGQEILRLNFSAFSLLIEHILFDFEIDTDTSVSILQNLIYEKREKLLLDTPIILFKLLLSAKSQKLVNYFDYLLEDVELKDERDERFTELIIDDLFKTTTINGMQKHNLKVAMHYINGQYYLKKALERLNG